VFNDHPEDKPTILASDPLHESQIVDELCFESNKSALQNYQKRSSNLARQHGRAHELSRLYVGGIKEKMEECAQETEMTRARYDDWLREQSRKMDSMKSLKDRYTIIASQTGRMSLEANSNAEDAASYLEDLQEFALTDGRQKPGATWSLEEACESGKIRPPNVQDDDGFPLGLEDIDKKRGNGCISMLYSLRNHGFGFNPLCPYWNADNMEGKESPKVRLALVLQFPLLDILEKFGSRQFEVGCKQVFGELKANEVFHAVNFSDGTLVSEATVNLHENADVDAAPTSPSESSAGGAPDGMVAVSAKLWEQHQQFLLEKGQK
jgi:hypothetical protein